MNIDKNFSISAKFFVAFFFALPFVLLYAAKATMVLLGVLLVAHMRKKPVLTKMDALPLLALLGAGIGLPFAYDGAAAIHSLMLTAALFVGGIVFLGATKETKLDDTSVYAFVLGAYLAIALSILDTAHMGPASVALSPAEFQKFLDKNGNRGLCAMAVVLWPFLYRLWDMHRGKAVALVVAFTILLAVRPSASACLAFGAGGMVALSGVVLRARTVPTLKTLLLGCVATFPWFAAILFAKVASLPLPPSFMHRIYIWHFAFERWLERPWFGWGMNASRIMPGGTDYFPGTSFVQLPLHPHNAVMQALLEQGVVGYALVLGGFGLVVSRARSPMALATLAAFMAPALFAFGMWQGWWVATGFLAAHLVYANKVAPSPSL